MSYAFVGAYSSVRTANSSLAFILNVAMPERNNQPGECQPAMPESNRMPRLSHRRSVIGDFEFRPQ
jgi:hypothetical protein